MINTLLQLTGYIRRMRVAVIAITFITGMNVVNASGSWEIETADNSVGDVGQYTSIAVDSDKKVHISYYDFTNGYLKYATNASGTWAIDTVDSNSDVGQYTSIATDSNNKVHISYYDVTNGDLKYATKTSGIWSTETIDSTDDVGWDTSIAIDSNNKVHISYYDPTKGYLKYATNASGSWVIEAADNSGDVGGYTSIVLDSNNKAHISYYDLNGLLRYATNASGSWVIVSADSSGDVGGYTSIALDSNNKVHISYYDLTNDDLKYATNASGSWVIETADNSGFVGWYTSIAIDSNNKAHISYYDLINGDLRYATNASGSWVTSAIDETGDIGWDTSIYVSNEVHISYYDFTNGDLKYAHADTITPAIVSTSPANNATGIALNTVITATFSEDMNSATIDTSTFSLSGGVTGTVTYDAPARTATFTPSVDLTFNTTYTATITTAVKDLAGNPMALSSFSFTTIVDNTPPTPEPGVTPAISFNGAVAVTNTAYSYSNIDISWTPYLDAVKYELDMGTVEGGTDLVNETSLTNITSYKKDLLANMNLFGKPVYITVKAFDQAGNESILKTSFVYTPADINSKSGQGDGRVDGFDLGMLGIAYNPFDPVLTGQEAADINRNGVVDFDDLSILAVNFGKVKP